MKSVRVAFTNFWAGFDPRSNNFLALLARRFNVAVEDQPSRATVVFESYFRRVVTRGSTTVQDDLIQGGDQVKIFFSGEPLNLPVGRHHAVISTNVLGAPGHFRYPLWMLNFQLGDDATNVERRRFGRNVTFDMTQRELCPDARHRFACSIFNNKSHFRYEAIRQLRAYGDVDVYGRAAGKPIDSKYEVLIDYRMNLCLENSIQPGYVTEKALEARAAGCLPLWWGDPSYRLDFNERSVINLYEYDLNIERAFDEVDLIEVGSTPLLKRHPDEINANLEDFLYHLVSNPPRRLFLEERMPLVGNRL